MRKINLKGLTMMNSYRFAGKTSKELFLIKGINVFAERWVRTGKCATVTNPENGKTCVLSKYESGGVEFLAGKDSNGYWLFFVEK